LIFRMIPSFILSLAVYLARISHELLAATTDMAGLPCVLGCWLLRRTVQVRLGTNPAVPRDGCQVQAHLHGLVTTIHEISGLRFYIVNEAKCVP